jgi:hypothetical protein
MAKPRYTIWEAINAALSVGRKALAETRQLARQPGPPGRDGFGFDDLDFQQVGDRNFVLRFVRGDEVKEFPITVPSAIHRGVYREGQRYERGDMATWGGSLWHCDEPTSDKPDGGKGWTLAAKRGRDGKDAKPVP